MIGTDRAADRHTTLGLGVNAVLDLKADHLEDAGEFDVVSTSSVARSSTVRLRFCVPAARSLPSPGSHGPTEGWQPCRSDGPRVIRTSHRPLARRCVRRQFTALSGRTRLPGKSSA